MKVNILLLPGYGEQSEHKNEQFHLFYSLPLGGAAAGCDHYLYSGLIVLLPVWPSLIRLANSRTLSGAGNAQDVTNFWNTNQGPA
jgi:hypothetical protein